LQLNVKEGIITGAKLYSDAMDWALPEVVETALIGCKLDNTAIRQALSALDAEICADLCRMLSQQAM